MVLAALISRLRSPWNNFWNNSISHLYNLQNITPVPLKQLPSPPWGRGIPDTVSETCGARHALLSSGLLGVQWPSRPTDHSPPASGSAVWPSVCPRVNQTCDTRRSCSGRSSGNKPQGSPDEPLCPSDFRQLGSRWSCHLLLWQKNCVKESGQIYGSFVSFLSSSVTQIFSPGLSTRTKTHRVWSVCTCWEMSLAPTAPL